MKYYVLLQRLDGLKLVGFKDAFLRGDYMADFKEDDDNFIVLVFDGAVVETLL